MNKTKTILLVILVSVAVVAGYFILQKANQTKSDVNQNLTDLATRINDEDGVSVEVTPINFENGKQIQFKIALTTHQGDLDFDLTRQSVLVDSQGNQYLPLEWQGGQGGHHLSGVLIFPPPKEGAKQFKLTIKNIFEVGERIFEWNSE